MLSLDVIFGSPLMPDLLGIIAGHLYYFLTVLHPLAGGKNMLKTPNWVYPFSDHSDALLPLFLCFKSVWGFHLPLVNLPVSCIYVPLLGCV